MRLNHHHIATERTSSTSSNQDSSILHNHPDYIPPEQQDILLSDVTSEKLHISISAALEVQYLSPAKENQHSPLWGLIFGYNKRLLVNIVAAAAAARMAPTTRLLM